jgi:leader peptidase (prepilin peptidase)/N-methyltransferase
MQVLILISAGVGLLSGLAATIAVDLLIGVLSWRYAMLTAIVLATLDAALAARLSGHQSNWALPALFYLVAVGAVLTIIDARTHRLPNVVVLPSYAVIAALLSIASSGTGDWTALARAAIGGGALFTAYLLLALIYPPGMGFGDVKLAGLLGAVLAYRSGPLVVIATLIAFAGGGLAGIAVIVSGRGNAKSALPFGPFMIAGSLIAILLAP